MKEWVLTALSRWSNLEIVLQGETENFRKVPRIKWNYIQIFYRLLFPINNFKVPFLCAPLNRSRDSRSADKAINPLNFIRIIRVSGASLTEKEEILTTTKKTNLWIYVISTSSPWSSFLLFFCHKYKMSEFQRYYVTNLPNSIWVSITIVFYCRIHLHDSLYLLRMESSQKIAKSLKVE